MRCLVASSRVDITALLLCVEHLMWSMCESVEELLRPDAAPGSWMWSIHSLCNQLLTILVILTSPLAELHRWQKSRDKLAGLLRTTGARLVIWWESVYLFIWGFFSLSLSLSFSPGFFREAVVEEAAELQNFQREWTVVTQCGWA